MFRPSARTDEQLMAMLFETGHWTVNNHAGITLCITANLHESLYRAGQYERYAPIIDGITRLSGDKIGISPPQIRRLMSMVRRTRLYRPTKPTVDSIVA